MSLGEILILEDDAAVRQVLFILLSRAGYEPSCFADGNALLVSAKKRTPICILLDIRLPGRSGLEILTELRSKNCLAPILMVSGYGSVQIAVQAMKVGASDFIEKPFRDVDLLERIAKVIRPKELATALPALGSIRIPGWQEFTSREREIVDQIMLGKSTKEIARLLGLSPRTVEYHRISILNKARVKSTAQLMVAMLGS